MFNITELMKLTSEIQNPDSKIGQAVQGLIDIPKNQAHLKELINEVLQDNVTLRADIIELKTLLEKSCKTKNS